MSIDWASFTPASAVTGGCPRPALVALGAGKFQAVVFVAAMLAGMVVFELAERFGPRSGIRAGVQARENV